MIEMGCINLVCVCVCVYTHTHTHTKLIQPISIFPGITGFQCRYPFVGSLFLCYISHPSPLFIVFPLSPTLCFCSPSFITSLLLLSFLSPSLHPLSSACQYRILTSTVKGLRERTPPPPLSLPPSLGDM